MAPTVKPKKPLKSMEKLVDAPSVKKRSKKKNYDNYTIYIFKILRSIDNEMGISKQAMLIMNNMVTDLMENIASEASKLVSHSKKSTMSSADIESAIKLSIPGQLALHAHAESIKALNHYRRSVKTQQDSD